MVDLAVYSDGDRVPMTSIAERQGVSVNYLEQVFTALRKAGLVKSVKGAQGGYVLADSPANIRVGDILRALEGDLSLVDTSGPGNPGSIRAALKSMLWDRMNDGLNEIVDSMTLDRLADDYRAMNGLDGLMFYI